MRSRLVMQCELGNYAVEVLRQAGMQTWMVSWPADGVLAISAEGSEYEKIRARCLPATKERATQYPNFRAAMFGEHEGTA